MKDAGHYLLVGMRVVVVRIFELDVKKIWIGQAKNWFLDLTVHPYLLVWMFAVDAYIFSF